MGVEEDILASPFLDKLRGELEVDHEAFDILCENLRRLRIEWRGKEQVSKRVVQDLYIYPAVIQGVAAALTDRERAEAIGEMGILLDALIQDCLSD